MPGIVLPGMGAENPGNTGPTLDAERSCHSSFAGGRHNVMGAQKSYFLHKFFNILGYLRKNDT